MGSVTGEAAIHVAIASTKRVYRVDGTQTRNCAEAQCMKITGQIILTVIGLSAPEAICIESDLMDPTIAGHQSQPVLTSWTTSSYAHDWGH